MKKDNLIQNLIIIGIIFIAVLSRLLPHPPNFTPVLAISIFGGTYLTNKKAAFLIPLLAMLISDLFLGFHPTMFAVYLCMFSGVFIGILLQKKVNPLRIAFSTLSGSIIFYLVTNFAYWLTSGLYPLNISGLYQSYVMGLPFYRYTPMEMFGFSLLGDLIYSTILFSTYELLKRNLLDTKVNARI